MGAGAVPGECPTPVQADFIVAVDDVLRAELVTEDFPLALSNPNEERFRLVGPVRVAHPEFVISRARYFDVLIDFAGPLIRTRGRGVPFALAALRPFGRHAWSIDAPTGRLRPG